MTTRRILERHNVQTGGSGAQPLILAHGFGTDQTVWHFQIPVFARHHQLVLFDHAGAGGAEPAFSPARHDQLTAYVEDVLDICQALDLRDAIYVGHSMSAMIGVLAAVATPAHFSRLVLIQGSPRYLNDDDYVGGFTQADLDQLYAAVEQNYDAWAHAFASVAMGNADRPELAARFAATLAAVPPAVAQVVVRVLFQSDVRAALPQLTVPTLVIQADDDIAVPVAVGDYLARTIPHAQLQRIAATGHLPHLSAPEAVNAAIRAYLADGRR